MKFKGTIIITDPCYIMRDYSDEGPKFNTWPGLEGVTPSTKFEDYTEAQLEAYKEYRAAHYKFENEHDDWGKCNYGECMQKLGINHFITENTIYGDWSCSTYKTDDPQEVVDSVAAISKYFNDKYEELGGYKKITDEQYADLRDECNAMQDDLNLEVEYIGAFCADAGLVSVFLLDEVKKYNPDIEEWIATHKWCVTTIEDFDGDVEYYVDEAGDAHIIGTGSVNFFTSQTGL